MSSGWAAAWAPMTKEVAGTVGRGPAGSSCGAESPSQGPEVVVVVGLRSCPGGPWPSGPMGDAALERWPGREPGMVVVVVVDVEVVVDVPWLVVVVVVPFGF